MNRRNSIPIALALFVICSQAVLSGNTAAAGGLRRGGRARICAPVCRSAYPTCSFRCYPCCPLSCATHIGSSVAVAPAPSTFTGKVHCIIAADTLDPDLGDYVEEDLQMMQALLAKLYGMLGAGTNLESIDTYHELAGERFTIQEMDRVFDEIRPAPTDVIFVYVSSHGATDEDSGQHAIKFSGDEFLARADVLDKIRTKRVRFAALLTDACANPVDLDMPQVRSAPTDGTLLRSLLIDNTGLVDINACAPGEQSVSTPEGSIMTRAFVRLADVPVAVSKLDKNGDKKISWKEEFFPALCEETQREYQNKAKDPANKGYELFEEQKGQNPHAYSELAVVRR